MTVSATNGYSGVFVGNGATTAFPYTFKALTADEVRVEVDGEVVASGYTVTLGTNGNGGTVTFATAPSTDAEIVIASDPDFEQEVSFTNAGQFLASTHDLVADRGAIRDIVLKRDIDRAIKLPIGSSPTDVAVDDVAGMFLAFDADGNPIGSSGTGADAGLRTDLATAGGYSLVNQLPGGVIGDGTTNDQAALQAAITAAAGGTLTLPPLDYNLGTGQLTIPASTTVIAYGANFLSSRTASGPVVQMGADSRLLGLRIYNDQLSSSAWQLEPGVRSSVEDVTLEKIEGGNGVQSYTYVNDVTMTGCKVLGGNGILVINASNLLLLNCHLRLRATGGDDALAVKATASAVRNIRMIGCYVENANNVMAIGSEIGLLGVNDPTYALRVSGFQLIGNHAKNCASILYIKPGAVEIYDFRDGLVENGIVSDNVLEDLAGTKMTKPFNITAARGGIARFITGSNNVIKGRAASAGMPGCYFFIPNVTGGSAEAELSDIKIGYSIQDVYQGLSNHASRPGYPFVSACWFEQTDPTYGIIDRITPEIDANGTGFYGVYVGPGLVDFGIDFARLRVKNINQETDSSGAGIISSSKVRISDPAPRVDMISGSPYREHTDSGYTGEIVHTVEETYLTSAIAANANVSKTAWTAGQQRRQIFKIEMMSSTAVAADNTDYMTLALANMSLLGTTFHTADTKATASGDVGNPQVTFTADEWTTILTGRTITNVSNKAQLLVPRDGRIKMTHGFGGAGKAVSDQRIRVSSAPY